MVLSTLGGVFFPLFSPDFSGVLFFFSFMLYNFHFRTSILTSMDFLRAFEFEGMIYRLFLKIPPNLPSGLLLKLLG